jgi:hypothetical protein
MSGRSVLQLPRQKDGLCKTLGFSGLKCDLLWKNNAAAGLVLNATSVPRRAVRSHDAGRRWSIGEFFPNRRSKHHCREPRVRRVGGLPLVDGFPFPKGTGLIRGQAKKSADGCRFQPTPNVFS